MSKIPTKPLSALLNTNISTNYPCCGPNGCGSEPNTNTAPSPNTDKDTTDGTDKE